MLFEPSTVLILGAGASQPYNFPLGPGLKNQIIQHCSNTQSAHGKQMLEAGYTEAQIREFHTDLVRSIYPTIDAFLEYRPSRRDIAAFAIAQVLMPLENEDNLYPPKDWYPMLFQELNLKDTQSTSGISGIVTFNYERSVEHYLTETARRSFENQTRDAALAKLKSLPIIYVHGKFGTYPDLPYKPQRSVEELKLGAKGISMIHEDHLEESPEFKNAQTLIKNATDVIFLGFGYDQRSLKRLGILDSHDPPSVYGTAVALSQEKREEVMTAFDEKIILDNNNYGISQFLPHLHNAVKLQEREKKAKETTVNAKSSDSRNQP